MKQENNCALPQEGAFRTTIGGQALIEGILMRGPEKQAIVVRQPGGRTGGQGANPEAHQGPLPILGLPFLRGVVNFLASLVEGVKALMWSADFTLTRRRRSRPPSLKPGWKSTLAMRG